MSNPKLTEDKGITITIARDEYKFLIKTIEDQKNFIFKLGMHPLVKQEALRGLRIIGSILQKGAV